jgi:hypothetical protein
VRETKDIPPVIGPADQSDPYFRCYERTNTCNKLVRREGGRVRKSKREEGDGRHPTVNSCLVRTLVSSSFLSFSSQHFETNRQEDHIQTSKLC